MATHPESSVLHLEFWMHAIVNKASSRYTSLIAQQTTASVLPSTAKHFVAVFNFFQVNTFWTYSTKIEKFKKNQQ